MTSHKWTDDFDAAVRQMSAAPPSEGLRDRIVARVGAEPLPRRLRLWWLVPATGLAAAAVLAVVLMRAPAADQPAPITATAAVDQPVLTPLRPANPVTAESPKRPARVRARTVMPSEAELAWRERSVPALAGPEALALRAIQPEALEVPQLEVKPIVIPPANAGSSEGGGGR